MLRQRRKKEQRETDRRQTEFPVSPEEDEDPSHGDRRDYPIGERSEQNCHEPIVLRMPRPEQTARSGRG